MSYLDKPLSERKQHLRLDTPCKERGGYSTMFRGLLADFLGTDIFIDKKIVLCHSCHNAKCSNAEHLYWGSYKENIDDQIANGTWKNVWERRVEKHGLEEATKQQARGDKSAGGKANKGKPKSEEHKKKIAEAIKRKYNKDIAPMMK